MGMFLASVTEYFRKTYLQNTRANGMMVPVDQRVARLIFVV